LRLLGLIALALIMGVHAKADKLLKIEVTDTNNYQTTTLHHPANLTAQPDTALNCYVSERVTFRHQDEPQLFIEVMDWVASQWQHDGFNQPPRDMTSLEILKNVHENGERYRCVEYGKVMADILSSMGHYSRQIGLRSVDAAYGGWGRGHVATEVWSNTLDKWVFFDPQYSIYAVHQGEYLNIDDIHRLKARGMFESIDYVVTPEFAAANDLDVEETLEGYAGFLNNYLGCHTSGRDLGNGPIGIHYLMETDTPALTFQGMGSGAPVICTREAELAYPKLNQTVVAMAAQARQDVDFMTIMEEHGIETEEQFLEHMWRFAAEGVVVVSLSSNMVDLEKYQIRIDGGKWVDHDSEDFEWTLNEGQNRFEVRSMSSGGVPGPVTFVEVTFE